MSEHHDHDHPHDHAHEPTAEDRARALESLLVEKGLITTETIDAYLSHLESDVGPLRGARVVAHAWLDEGFKRRLLTDAPAAMREMGIDPGALRLIVVESTPEVHNVVCCTLCSCYPWRVLGLPPSWYKSPAYRSRIVIDPRSVLREFGCEVDESIEVRVWDSTSECRYMVLPRRPEGTEGMTEDELIALVTRDSLVGVTRLEAPEPVG